MAKITVERGVCNLGFAGFPKHGGWDREGWAVVINHCPVAWFIHKSVADEFAKQIEGQEDELVRSTPSDN